MIHYVEGDATDPQGEGYKIIAHVVNNRGAWGAGFSGALSGRYPSAKQAYRSWAEGYVGAGENSFLLGHVLFSSIVKGMIAHLCAQDGYGTDGRKYIDYAALRLCLKRFATAVERNIPIHMPRIGCGLAGGKWEEVEPIIAEELKDFQVYVYDLPKGEGTE